MHHHVTHHHNALLLFMSDTQLAATIVKASRDLSLLKDAIAAATASSPASSEAVASALSAIKVRAVDLESSLGEAAALTAYVGVKHDDVC